MRSRNNLFLTLLAASMALSGSRPASGAAPVDVVLFGAQSFVALDALDGMDGLYHVAGKLTLMPGSSINCNDAGPGSASACSIRIVVDGTMEMKEGSAIRAENTAGGGSGGDITLEVDGGSLTIGGVISSRKIAGTDTTGAGDIGIAVNGCATLASGIEIKADASITSDGNGEAGSISLLSCHRIAVDGSIRSRGLTANGRGGPITLKASGVISEGPAGSVSSRGVGPGADLVHLEGNAIEIRGLVESAGPGQVPFRGKNLCNEPTRAGKPANSTACVELWAFGSAVIDAGGENNGEISADTGFSGGTQGTGWIDILALGGDIAIVGDSALPYAVHANQGLTNGHGGFIQAFASFGKITTAGNAIQANDKTAGGKGGRVIVEATFSTAGVELGTASIQAEGALVGGGGPAGGYIEVRAFAGEITGVAPGELNSRGGPAPGNGTVILSPCGPLSYSGIATPALTFFPICAAAPDYPVCTID